MIKSTAGILFINLTGVGLNLVMTVLLARVLGAQGYAVYVTLFAVATLASAGIMGGLPNIMLRETSVSLQDKDPARIGAALLFALVFAGVTTTIVAVLVYPAWQMWGGNVAVTTRVLVLTIALAFSMAVAEIASGFLQGLHEIKLGRLIVIFRPLFLVVFLLICIGLGLDQGLDVQTAVVLHGGAAAIAACLLLSFLVRTMPQKVMAMRHPTEWNRLGKSTIIAFFLHLGGTLQRTLPILLLASLAEIQQTGYFQVAERLAFFVSFGLTAVGLALRPRIATLNRAGDRVGMQKMLRESAWIILLASLPVAAILIGFRMQLVSLLFGEAFLPAVSVFVILVAAQVANALAGLTTATLVMIGHEKIATLASWVSVSLMVITAYILIPQNGAFGAGIASSIGLISANIMMLGYLIFKVGISTAIISVPKRWHEKK